MLTLMIHLLMQDYRPAQTIVGCNLITRAIMSARPQTGPDTVCKSVIHELRSLTFCKIASLTYPKLRPLLFHRSTSGKRRLSSELR